MGSAVPGAVVEAFEHGVSAVELVAGGGEVLADGADVGAAGDAVLQERNLSNQMRHQAACVVCGDDVV